MLRVFSRATSKRSIPPPPSTTTIKRRTYVVPSFPTNRAATATATASHQPSTEDNHHTHSHTKLDALPTREQTATPRLSHLHEGSGGLHQLPSLTPAFTILPTPLPDDRISRSSTAASRASSHGSYHTRDPSETSTPDTRTQSELYPSTGLLDALSLISVCLKRKETTPRGYEIFKRIVRDAQEGRCAVPDAAVWGSVVEGVTALARVSPSLPTEGRRLVDERAEQIRRLEAESWERKGRELVVLWEGLSEGSLADKGGLKGRPVGVQRGGEKVYQGWLRGLLHSGSSLQPFLPYLDPPSQLHLSELVTAFNTQDREILFTRLAEEAQLTGRSELGREVEVVKGQQEERRKRALAGGWKDVVQVKPILAKERYTSKFAEDAGVIGDQDSMDGLPRFAIANLRATLKGLETGADDLPIRRQEALEAASLQAARAELEHAHEQMVQMGLKDVADSQKLGSGRLQAWMWDWLQCMTKRLEVDLQALDEVEEKAQEKAGKRSASIMASSSSAKVESVVDVSFDRTAASPDLALYLRLLSPDRLALVTILEIMRLGNSGGVSDGMKTLRALLAVGKAVETEYRASTMQSIIGEDSGSWLRSIGGGGDGSGAQQGGGERSIRAAWDRIGKTVGAAAAGEGQENTAAAFNRLDEFTIESLRQVWTPDWTQAKHLAIGSFLVRALIDTAKVTRYMKDADGVEHVEEQPAFAHAYEYVKGNKLGIIKLNPAVSSRIAKDDMSVVMHPKHLPMLIPPRPWKSFEDGGYLFHKVPVMRFKESAEQTTYLKRASEAGRLDSVFAGLNVLSSTPWAINRQVFDVVLQCWNSGEAIADIPAAEGVAQYNIPERPDPRDTDPESRSKYVAALRTVTNQMAKDHSERCKFNYNLEIARSYLNDVFYIPHNLDFRGRAYPIPPHLNPVGDDLARGLLTFGIKKPLGERGLMWLRIHLANLYGFDKASFKDREQFAIDHEKDIFDSADDPLGGAKWWLQAEDPWQCLACCIDIAAALRSPDPTAYLSSLPVHQDGTCNGMQHYAALGGDTQGARAVNLEGGDKPADVYTHIADLVNIIVNRDAEAGQALAVAAKGKVLRKVVKQTVMTTVYGVTFIGAKDQIAKQLNAKGEIPRDLVYFVSTYLAKTVLNCIGDIFSGARAIQDWLTVSAKLISRSIPTERVPMSLEPLVSGPSAKQKLSASGKPLTRLTKELMTSVVWTSPLGLPVVQPYRKPVRKQVMTSLQTVYIADPNAVAEVAPGKQATAMPPNFIHSLDATHMLLTAMQCKEDDVTFASVHDSYWSHACSIDKLSENIREMFIDLHSRDIIGDLRLEFIERYSDHVIPLAIARGILNGKRGLRAMSALNATETDEDAVNIEEEMDEDPLVEEDAAAAEAPAPYAKRPRKHKAPSSQLLHPDGTPIELLEYDGKSFVRFADCLPPCPPKGEFDVNRIRLSPYFFS
ncbi:hypothetical protein QFC22_006567 [Naganishia vaughanmartiniae]|uniref:Uncharacterized protein n=1 Tax=Naganishia vaughanmartiniae TaxID=1424756 RepID=A0ACC2WJK8_9TREE|nr:hypothetical protein QFC22_006567 [Naganishia vaughanmartiniae]